MIGRSETVAKRFVEKLFEKNPNGVERHLSREQILEIAIAAYEIGHSDGVKAARGEAK